MQMNSHTRFSDRVADYVRYRPDYPDALFELLRREASLGPGTSVADVGSGTGISARRFAETGATVFAVEPNAAMRDQGADERIVSIDGSAERTTLPDARVELVAAFQSFHWFDRSAARQEFARILKPQGLVALVWNDRLEDATPFLRGYEALLREFSNDNLAVRHGAVSQGDLDAWFGGGMRTARFENAQTFDFEGVLGRLLSSSYAPPVGHPQHAPMVSALQELFDRTQESGRVQFLYATNAYYGPLD